MNWQLKTKNLAFAIGEKITLSIQIDRCLFPESVLFVLRNDDGIISKTQIDEFYLEDEYICCDATVDKLNTGLYFFEFYLEEAETISEQLLVFDDSLARSGLFGGGIVYHIFVDRFYKYGEAAKRQDAVYLEDWDNDRVEYAENPGDFLPNNSFFGGTLYGVTEKLSYIKSLGVSCIYLSPVFEAYSNHKYDTGDFLKVDDGFGGDEALKKLINAANAYGIKIILDCAFNHTGDDSVYFNKYGKYKTLGAYQSTQSPYFEWYNFTAHPETYECWWGVKVLPRTVRTKSYRAFICDKVLPKYLDMGIAGVRLDVADELEDDFLEQITAAVKGYGTDKIVVGEVWEDASNKVAYGVRKSYFYGKSLDGVTNYPLRNGIIEFIKTGDKALLTETIETLLSHYPKSCIENSLNFLGSHDTERIITVLGGENGEGKSGSELVDLRMSDEEYNKAKSLVKLAFLLLLTLPGTPCIYYGDEVGIEGYRDPFNRRPFPWWHEDKEITDFIRLVASKRTMIKSEFRLIEASDRCFAFETDMCICAVNMSQYAEEINIDGEYIDVINGNSYKDILTVKSKNGVLAFRGVEYENKCS